MRWLARHIEGGAQPWHASGNGETAAVSYFNRVDACRRREIRERGHNVGIAETIKCRPVIYIVNGGRSGEDSTGRQHGEMGDAHLYSVVSVACREMATEKREGDVRKVVSEEEDTMVEMLPVD